MTPRVIFELQPDGRLFIDQYDGSSVCCRIQIKPDRAPGIMQSWDEMFEKYLQRKEGEPGHAR